MAKTKKAKPAAKSASGRPSVGERALFSVREAGAHARGEHAPGLVVHQPVNVKALREKTGMSQSEFAASFGLSAATLRDWEQNRKQPERTARILLRVIDVAPDIVRKIANQVG
ncbi:MAG: helix-turn-helix domain-containing protein [Alphaproteobacteria bacterium]|nr:helix-turn-helix domain-containing protein [Alphaproteobacteria bacterium]